MGECKKTEGMENLSEEQAEQVVGGRTKVEALRVVGASEEDCKKVVNMKTEDAVGTAGAAKADGSATLQL